MLYYLVWIQLLIAHNFGVVLIKLIRVGVLGADGSMGRHIIPMAVLYRVMLPIKMI